MFLCYLLACFIREPTDSDLLPLTLEPNLDDDFFPLTMQPTPFVEDGRQVTTPPVAEPTDAPTNFANLFSDSPSSAPTERPSTMPVPDPTPAPVPDPTPAPVPDPTPAPVPDPTAAPVLPTPAPVNPTPAPVIPTAAPVTPTAAPVNPTAAPVVSTPRPTLRPTPAPVVPTPPPTFRPTRRPTDPPTFAPSGSPTSMPSAEPTLVLSQDPTPSGTLEPTQYPSGFPTMAPSVSPQPSSSPTTAAPSATPSDEPSYSPTPYPSPVPSGEPSSAPSLPLQREVVQARMALFPFPDGQTLGRADRVDWSAVTESQIRSSILNSDIDPPVDLESLRTSIEIQVPPGGSTAITSSNSSQRLLQAEEDVATLQPDALLIVFDVYIDFRSVSNEQDVDSWVFSAFDTSLDRAEYVRDLQQKSPTFNPVEDVETAVEGYVPPPTQAPSSGGGNANVAVIVGALDGCGETEGAIVGNPEGY